LTYTTENTYLDEYNGKKPKHQIGWEIKIRMQNTISFCFFVPIYLDNDKRLGKIVDTPMKALVGTNSMKNIPSKSDEYKQSNYPANAILVLALLFIKFISDSYEVSLIVFLMRSQTR
jgi:hypothetical protein